MTSSESRSAQPRLQERRRNRRLRITPLVYLKVLPNNGGLLVDLSVSGMCVSLAKPLAISKEVRFSFSLAEHRKIEGVARICWLSGSGRKAGLEFAECSNMSMEQIAALVGDEGMSQSVVASGISLKDPSARLDSRAPAVDASPRQEIPAPAETRNDGRPTVPDTPLFFLPQKREVHEEVIPDLSDELPRSAEQEGEKSGGDGSVLRSALASGAAEEEEARRKKHALRKTVARMVLLLILAVLCFAAYRYEGPLLRLEKLLPGAEDAINPTLSKNAIQRRVIRRSGRPLQNSGEIARADRSGHVYSFRAPGISGAAFSIQGSFPGIQGPSLRSSEGAPSSVDPQNAGAGISSKSFSGVKFIGLMATLRNDGALVEEGGIPASPPKPSNPTSALEQIVLDVVVGRNGKVKDIRTISSPDSKLAQAVIQSVRKWVYQPLYEDGQAVEFTTRITLNFAKPAR